MTTLNQAIAGVEAENPHPPDPGDSLLTQLTTLTDQKSAAETELFSLAAPISTLDAQIVTAQNVLRSLEIQKKPARDAVNAQRAVVVGLQAQLGDLQDRVRAIDGQIAIGGCVAYGDPRPGVQLSAGLPAAAVTGPDEPRGGAMDAVRSSCPPWCRVTHGALAGEDDLVHVGATTMVGGIPVRLCASVDPADD